MSIIQGTSKSSAATYEIEQSIRFNQADSARLTRTPSSAGNRKTFTFSCWLKRGNISTNAARFFTGYQDANNQFEVYFNTSDQLKFAQRMGGTWYERATDAKYRDSSAWYHIVWYFDTTDATAEDRMRGYVNGERVTFASGSNPGLNADGMVNATIQHEIAGEQAGTAYYYDGYIAEIHLIDGQALDPTSFGETNSTTGQWVPIEYTGSYGTNGFYLKGQDSSALGDDSSGNGNDFTSSGLTAADQVSDSPTNNQSTLNPLWAGAGLSDGNLVATATGNSYQWALSTFAVDDGGKWVAEFQKSSGTFGYVGLYQLGNHTSTTGNNYGYFYNLGTGEIVKNGSIVTDLGTGAANSLMRLEYDSATDTLEFFDDGSSIHSATTGLSGHNSLHFGCAPYASGTIITATFSPLSGTPTTGFNELTTANLDDPTIADPSAYFQTTLYTGNGSTQEVNQSGNSTFEPGWVWIKTRSNAASHALFDQVRGVNKQLRSDSTGTEYTAYSDLLTAFDADGFTLGADATVNNVNVNTYTYAAWQWKADGTSGSSNTDGSITSTVSADTTSGFSIVSYTGTGSAATVGHGLGVAPSMIIAKNRSTTSNWSGYHVDLGATKTINLNETAAAQTSSGNWNNTEPTSSVFSVNTATGTNGSGNSIVAYCFSEVEGFSKFGSYTGNGSTDGPFIYTGFMPEFIMVKSSSNSSTNWDMLDATRETFNTRGNQLFANSSAAEASNDHECDFLSNGFKWRDTSSSVNASGATYIVMAFARSPFKTATAR